MDYINVSPKLTSSQLNLPQGTKQKSNEETKTKNGDATSHNYNTKIYNAHM